MKARPTECASPSERMVTEMPGDAVTVAPHVYKVLLENDRVRILEIKIEPGGSSEMHSHPDLAAYAVTDCTWELTSEDGETVTAEIPAGGVLYQEATSHAAKDVGASGSLAIAIELK